MSVAEPGQGSFRVRYGNGGDVPLIRAWLPESLHGMPPAVHGLAWDPAADRVAGMAYVRIFRDDVGRFRVFVAPEYRRRGCGTLLLECVRHLALAVRAARLLTTWTYDPELADETATGELAFYRSRGLSVAQELTYYHSELSAALAVLEPLYRRGLRGQPREPATHIVPADRVDSADLADFAVRHVGGLSDEVAARLRGACRAYSPVTSMVALRRDRIVGALLNVLQGESVFIETRAVEAEHRGGWINLALMYSSAAVAAQLGVKTIDFAGDTLDRDTARLARRLRATIVGRRQSWGCPVRGAVDETGPRRP